MADPVDQASFAQLVARFSALMDQYRALVSRVQIQQLSGPGPWTLSEADHGGKALSVSNYTATGSISLMLPADAANGALFLVDQVGPAPVRFVPAGGAMLNHRLGHNGTAGQWASISAKCIANPNGSSAMWLLAGDTAAVG